MQNWRKMPSSEKNTTESNNKMRIHIYAHCARNTEAIVNTFHRIAYENENSYAKSKWPIDSCHRESFGVRVR